jgi:hypothetical protein
MPPALYDLPQGTEDRPHLDRRQSAATPRTSTARFGTMSGLPARSTTAKGSSVVAPTWSVGEFRDGYGERGMGGEDLKSNWSDGGGQIEVLNVYNDPGADFDNVRLWAFVGLLNTHRASNKYAIFIRIIRLINVLYAVLYVLYALLYFFNTFLYVCI